MLRDVRKSFETIKHSAKETMSTRLHYCNVVKIFSIIFRIDPCSRLYYVEAVISINFRLIRLHPVYNSWRLENLVHGEKFKSLYLRNSDNNQYESLFVLMLKNVKTFLKKKLLSRSL